MSLSVFLERFRGIIRNKHSRSTTATIHRPVNFMRLIRRINHQSSINYPVVISTLSLSNTQDVTRSSKLSRTDIYIYIRSHSIYYAISRDNSLLLSTFVVDKHRCYSYLLARLASEDSLRDCVSQSYRGLYSGWTRGPNQRGTNRRRTTHTPFVFRSFSAERRRTNKSWDPGWNCVGRLLLLPPRQTVLSHRAREHRQRQAGE